MDKTACTQINEEQGDSKDFRIKLCSIGCAVEATEQDFRSNTQNYQSDRNHQK
jgi:hypothetical protein